MYVEVKNSDLTFMPQRISIQAGSSIKSVQDIGTVRHHNLDSAGSMSQCVLYREVPLYKGQFPRSQCFLYREVPLYEGQFPRSHCVLYRKILTVSKVPMFPL